MSLLSEVKNVVYRIEKLKPKWNVKRIFMSTLDMSPKSEIPDEFRQDGLGLYYTSYDGIKVEICKAPDCASFSTKWRDSEVFYWRFRVSVRTDKPEVIYEETFLNNRKVRRLFKVYDPDVCDYLDEYIKNVGLPVLVEEEEKKMREHQERESRRIAEEEGKPPPPPSAKDRFWSG